MMVRAMVNEEIKKVGVEELTPIPVQLPPVLMRMIGYEANARFVAIYYLASKATWNDGLQLSTFSYYNVYEPLKEHPAVALRLLDANLGNDDEMPTHALLCDREERKLYVGEFERVLALCRQQHPEELSADYLAEYRGAVEREEPTTAGDFNRLGMFELFTRPDEGAERETVLLRQWLDAQLTEELIRELFEKFNGGELRLYQQAVYVSELLISARRAAIVGRYRRALIARDPHATARALEEAYGASKNDPDINDAIKAVDHELSETLKEEEEL